MTVGNKFAWTSSGLIVAAVLLGGVSIRNLALVNEKTRAIIVDPLPGMARISQAEAELLELRGDVWRHIASRDPADLAVIEQEIEELKGKIDHALQEYEKTIFTAEDRGLFQKIGPLWKRYLDMLQSVLELSRAGKDAEAHKKYITDLTTAEDAVRAALRTVSDLNRRNGESYAEESQQAYTHAVWTLGITLAICAAGGSVLAFAVVRGVNREQLEKRVAERTTALIEANEQLTHTSEQLRALSASVQRTREEEGTRIAREIHDELGAALTSLKWDLDWLRQMVSEAGNPTALPGASEKLESMMGLAGTTIETVRRIASELRPSVLDDLGLTEAIEWQAQQFQARTRIVCECGPAPDNVDIDQAQSTAVFRIFQEALTNILRHAQATRVEVAMEEQDDGFVLTVRDNGRGITDEEKSGALSLGLLGMRERADLVGGKIDITGVKGGGTTVTIRIPTSQPGNG
jgi:signal transduction histidine kinase